MAGRCDLTSIHEAKAAGIGMVFQEFSLVPTLTVAQNIYLTAEPMSSRSDQRPGGVRQRAARSSPRWRSTSTRGPGSGS